MRCENLDLGQGVTPFILATVLAAFIVIATTGFRAMKAALANPVDSLRDE
jgi:putative ABC transport system permease protein